MKNYSRLIIIFFSLGLFLAVVGFITLFFDLILGLIFIFLGIASVAASWIFKRKEQQAEKENIDRIMTQSAQKAEREFQELSKKSGAAGKYKGKSLIKFLNDYTSIDVETTGFSPTTDSIIELAAVRVRNGNISEKFSSLVHVDNLPRKITTLTGITLAMLSDAPEIEEALDEFIKFVGSDIVIGHNVTFDIGFIHESSLRCFTKPFDNDYVDTYALSRRLLQPGSTPDYKLPTLIDSLNLPPSKSHRAKADALSTIYLYDYLKTSVANATV